MHHKLMIRLTYIKLYLFIVSIDPSINEHDIYLILHLLFSKNARALQYLTSQMTGVLLVVLDDILDPIIII